MKFWGMAGCWVIVGFGLLASPLRAQIIMDQLPESARAIEVEDRVGDFIPLDLVFADERGRNVPLKNFFRQGKAIVLTLNYSDCPGLCMAQLDNLVSTLRELDGGGIGEKFDILTVSIDPTESNSKAARTKEKYTGMLRDTKANTGWHFLTGEQKSITDLAKSVGFHYSYDKDSKRYSHAAVTYFISPSGRICRYFVSLGEEPAQFKFALNDAGEGKLGPSMSDSFVQMCYSYDPDKNRYTANARWLLSLSAGAFVLLLVGFTAPFWFTKRGASGSTNAAQVGNADAANQPTANFDTNEASMNAYTKNMQSENTQTENTQTDRLSQEQVTLLQETQLTARHDS